MVTVPSELEFERAVAAGLPGYDIKYGTANTDEIQRLGQDEFIVRMDAPGVLPNSNPIAEGILARLWVFGADRHRVGLTVESLRTDIESAAISMTGQKVTGRTLAGREGPNYDDGIGAWFAFVEYQFFLFTE